MIFKDLPLKKSDFKNTLFLDTYSIITNLYYLLT